MPERVNIHALYCKRIAQENAKKKKKTIRNNKNKNK